MTEDSVAESLRTDVRAWMKSNVPDDWRERMTNCDQEVFVEQQRDLGRLSARVDAACALADRYLLKRISGEEAVGDASIVKLFYARTLREFTRLGQRIAGLGGHYNRGFMRGATQETGNWPVDLMTAYNWSIAGGSDELQRNIISERMLGIPREPRAWQLAEQG